MGSIIVSDASSGCYTLSQNSDCVRHTCDGRTTDAASLCHFTRGYISTSQAGLQSR
jgi:hypothetical protein